MVAAAARIRGASIFIVGPVFIRSRGSINLADSAAPPPVDRVICALGYSTRSGETIRLSVDGKPRAGGVETSPLVPVRAASRRIYSVVTAVETMKFNAANLHANPRDVNPASVYLAPGCV